MKIKLTIYNTCVHVTSQEQADRLRQVCIDNGLPIWNDKIAFRFDNINVKPVFECNNEGFAIYNSHSCIDKHIITETEWMELLKQHNDEKTT